MDKNQISNFLTPDIGYLLGLIIARGEIHYSNDNKKIVIDFEYKALYSKAITKNFDQRLHIQTSLDGVVSRLQNIGIDVRKDVFEKKVCLVLSWRNDDISWLFIKFLINGTRFSFHDFIVPESIFSANETIKREFLRGFSDVNGYVRNSNRDQKGKHRVYLEINNHNWLLPPQICQLLQSINIPVQYIGYGHPNLRGSKTHNSTAWAKEHQMKIFAEDFQQLGFYISHKNEALTELADYNRANFSSVQVLCEGETKYVRLKPAHPHEHNEKLPAALNGKHFNGFKEICKCLNCYKQDRDV